MLKYEVSKKIEMMEKGNKQVAELKKEVKLMDKQVKLLINQHTKYTKWLQKFQLKK